MNHKTLASMTKTLNSIFIYRDLTVPYMITVCPICMTVGDQNGMDITTMDTMEMGIIQAAVTVDIMEEGDLIMIQISKV